MGDAWEWDLADEVKVSARIETPNHVESVWLGPRLVSRSGAGGKLADHVVQLPAPKTQPQTAEVYRASAGPREAILTFDPAPALNVTLRVDGVIVPPTRVPDPDVLAPPLSARLLATPAIRNNKRNIIAGAAVALVVIGAVIGYPGISRALTARALRNKLIDAHAEKVFTEIAFSADRSLEATFPSDFEVNVDEEGATIGLHREKKLEMLALVSMPRPDLTDPADLDKIMMADLVTYAAKTKAKMSTTITKKETCHGDPDGVVSTATMTQLDGVDIKVVACTLLKDGRGFFFAYFVPEVIADEEEHTLRAIVDATKMYDPSNLTTTTVSVNARIGRGADDTDSDGNRVVQAPFDGPSGTIQGSATISPRGVRFNANGTIQNGNGVVTNAPGYPRGTTITSTPRPNDPNAFNGSRPRSTFSNLPPAPPRAQLRADPSAPDGRLNGGVAKSSSGASSSNRQKLPW